MPEQPSSILIVDDSGDSHAFTRSLAERLNAPVRQSSSEHDEALLLAVNREGMELREPQMKPGHGMSLDLTTLDLRIGSGGLSRRQPIAKAFGTNVRTIVDATAGTGQDAVLLAALGYHVLAIERSVVLHAMLEDALSRALGDETFSAAVDRRLAIRFGDARTVLPTIDPPPDAVYIDPMFPPKRRASALPRKEIQLLRKLVGDDHDADELFAAAMDVSRQRVVVKRPHHAPPLGNRPPLHFAGKLVRYDVHFTNET